MTATTNQEDNDREVNISFSTSFENSIPFGINDWMGELVYEQNFDLEDQKIGCYPRDELVIDRFRSDFFNPTKDVPVRIDDFLNYLDLSQITPTLLTFYDEEWRFGFPKEAVLKTLIYFKLKKYKFLTDLWRDLVATPELADNLGYDDIPDYKTLYHFLIVRLGSKGIKKILDAFIEANRIELLKYGIKLGEEVGLDATPIPAKKNDDEATYNGHYKMLCHMWHNMRCMKTNLPLEFHITNGTEDEAHFLAPFLMRMKYLKNIYPKKMYVDCGYTDFMNLARCGEYFDDLEIICNIGKSWNFHWKGTKKGINETYQKLWQKPFHKPDADFDWMIFKLMMTDETRFKQVGMYYRNHILAKYEECPDGYMDDYHQRNKIESHHGTEKRNFNIKNIEAKGIEKTTAHLGMHLIALHAIALCRLQNGITEGLTNTVGFV